MDMAGTSVIVLNSYKAAKDLLDTRSTMYSSRYVCCIVSRNELDTY